MQGWRCERCGYIHIAEEAAKMPTRCPSCRSTRLRPMPPKPAADTRYKLSLPEIYAMLNRISTLPVQEQEAARRLLKESAEIYILCIDERQGRLDEVLTRKEREEYRSLVRDQGFGLAVIGRTVVVVSPDSPIRMHVGVNRAKLDELEARSETGDQP